MSLSPLQREVLLHLYEQQRRYRSGEWRFDGTLWSRASYRVARAHGALRPSPAKGRKNVERAFEQRLGRARARLLKLELVAWRKTRPPEAPAGIALGYKRHRAQNRDLFLTAEGLAQAEELLVGTGRMAAPGAAACADLPGPTGPAPSGLGGCED